MHIGAESKCEMTYDWRSFASHAQLHRELTTSLTTSLASMHTATEFCRAYAKVKLSNMD